MKALLKKRKRIDEKFFSPYIGGIFELINDVEKNHVRGEIKALRIKHGVLLVDFVWSKKRDIKYPELPHRWIPRRISHHEIDLKLISGYAKKDGYLFFLSKTIHDKVSFTLPAHS